MIEATGTLTRAVSNDGVIGAEFNLASAEYDRLQRSLERTFHGCSYFVVRP